MFAHLADATRLSGRGLAGHGPAYLLAHPHR
jgi:hypothetical protein